jgi:nicotinate dehydrogenase subunit A
MRFSLKVNGRSRPVDIEPETRLLYVLRNDLGLVGPKFGCGLGQCGSCTVLVDGEPVRSCLRRVSSVAEAEIVTLEGLGTASDPHPLQEAFITEQALQCGYCTSGMIVAAAALLEAEPDPSEERIREALADHLCRCGAHGRVVAAVRRAATARRRA